jgi:hypothetical protein
MRIYLTQRMELCPVNKRIGRPPSKAKPMLFKFKKPVAKFLRNEARRQGKTMVRILEEMLEERALVKP